mmetsp:Transcript_2929/g.4827  ORF Transcript_2929/g.4827 Transcript_2929/m.4827 type:complete len:93 (-) Transcript_2929:103-381(-)
MRHRVVGLGDAGTWKKWTSVTSDLSDSCEVRRRVRLADWLTGDAHAEGGDGGGVMSDDPESGVGKVARASRGSVPDCDSLAARASTCARVRC